MCIFQPATVVAVPPSAASWRRWQATSGLHAFSTFLYQRPSCFWLHLSKPRRLLDGKGACFYSGGSKRNLAPEQHAAGRRKLLERDGSLGEVCIECNTLTLSTSLFVDTADGWRPSYQTTTPPAFSRLEDADGWCTSTVSS